MGLLEASRSGSRLRRIVRSGAALAVVGAAAGFLALQAGALGSPASGTSQARLVGARGTTEQLTRWRKVGYWAHAAYAIPVHALPDTNSPIVTRLHFKTEDGFPEVYLVLQRQVAPDGRAWLKVALPMRPNGRDGWVVHGALGSLHQVHTWLVIDRSRLRARFYERNRALWSAPVGVGKPSIPTPTGLFWVREEFQLSNQAFYGPYAFGTSAYANISDWPGGGVVGLHGTSLPNLIPGRPSHGCVRLHNQDILWLAGHMPVGTPISIIN
jgi:L,D-transpeptidase catalytic domain